MSKLGEWITEKWKTQAKFGDKIGVRQGRVSKWVLGTEGITEEYQAKIRKAGYSGPWPQEEAKAASTGFITVEEFAEWRGYWKRGTEELLQSLKDLGHRVDQLEKRAGLSE